LREKRLARARCADQQHAFGRRAAEARVFRRIAKEIDDFDQFVLGFVDAGDIVERDLRILLLVVAACPALADAEQPTAEAAALLPGPPEEPDVKADQQQRRAES